MSKEVLSTKKNKKRNNSKVSDLSESLSLPLSPIINDYNLMTNNGAKNDLTAAINHYKNEFLLRLTRLSPEGGQAVIFLTGPKATDIVRDVHFSMIEEEEEAKTLHQLLKLRLDEGKEDKKVESPEAPNPLEIKINEVPRSTSRDSNRETSDKNKSPQILTWYISAEEEINSLLDVVNHFYKTLIDWQKTYSNFSEITEWLGYIAALKTYSGDTLSESLRKFIMQIGSNQKISLVINMPQFHYIEEINNWVNSMVVGKQSPILIILATSSDSLTASQQTILKNCRPNSDVETPDKVHVNTRDFLSLIDYPIIPTIRVSPKFISIKQDAENLCQEKVTKKNKNDLVTKYKTLKQQLKHHAREWEKDELGEIAELLIEFLRGAIKGDINFTTDLVALHLICLRGKMPENSKKVLEKTKEFMTSSAFKRASREEKLEVFTELIPHIDSTKELLEVTYKVFRLFTELDKPAKLKYVQPFGNIIFLKQNIIHDATYISRHNELINQLHELIQMFEANSLDLKQDENLCNFFAIVIRQIALKGDMVSAVMLNNVMCEYVLNQFKRNQVFTPALLTFLVMSHTVQVVGRMYPTLATRPKRDTNGKILQDEKGYIIVERTYAGRANVMQQELAELMAIYEKVKEIPQYGLKAVAAAANYLYVVINSRDGVTIENLQEMAELIQADPDDRFTHCTMTGTAMGAVPDVYTQDAYEQYRKMMEFMTLAQRMEGSSGLALYEGSPVISLIFYVLRTETLLVTNPTPVVFGRTYVESALREVMQGKKPREVLKTINYYLEPENRITTDSEDFTLDNICQAVMTKENFPQHLQVYVILALLGNPNALAHVLSARMYHETMQGNSSTAEHLARIFFEQKLWLGRSKFSYRLKADKEILWSIAQYERDTGKKSNLREFIKPPSDSTIRSLENKNRLIGAYKNDIGILYNLDYWEDTGQELTEHLTLVAGTYIFEGSDAGDKKFQELFVSNRETIEQKNLILLGEAYYRAARATNNSGNSQRWAQEAYKCFKKAKSIGMCMRLKTFYKGLDYNQILFDASNNLFIQRTADKLPVDSLEVMLKNVSMYQEKENKLSSEVAAVKKLIALKDKIVATIAGVNEIIGSSSDAASVTDKSSQSGSDNGSNSASGSHSATVSSGNSATAIHQAVDKKLFKRYAKSNKDSREEIETSRQANLTNRLQNELLKFKIIQLLQNLINQSTLTGMVEEIILVRREGKEQFVTYCEAQQDPISRKRFEVIDSARGITDPHKIPLNLLKNADPCGATLISTPHASPFRNDPAFSPRIENSQRPVLVLGLQDPLPEDQVDQVKQDFLSATYFVLKLNKECVTTHLQLDSDWLAFMATVSKILAQSQVSTLSPLGGDNIADYLVSYMAQICLKESENIDTIFSQIQTAKLMLAKPEDFLNKGQSPSSILGIILPLEMMYFRAILSHKGFEHAVLMLKNGNNEDNSYTRIAGNNSFGVFLHQERAVENLLFLNLIQLYRESPDTFLKFKIMQYILEMNIYDQENPTFTVYADQPDYINLTNAVRRELMKELKEGADDNQLVDISIFAAAEKEIKNLLSNTIGKYVKYLTDPKMRATRTNAPKPSSDSTSQSSGSDPGQKGTLPKPEPRNLPNEPS